MYKGIGKLRCFTKWALLECDDELGKMYRSLYSLEYFYKPKIQKPLWGSHISIIRGEGILNEDIKTILPSNIEYLYRSEMRTNGIHFWLPVCCPALDIIRDLFGLPHTLVDYHLSIGNIVESEYRTPEIYQ